MLGLGLVVTFIHLRVVTADRVAGAIELTALRSLGIKAVTVVVVSLPLLIGLALTLRRCWAERRTPTVVLVTGGAASLALYAVVTLPHWANEYKYVFTAAMCLMPFPALALEPLLRRAGRGSLALLAGVTLVLAAPLARKTYLFRTWGSPPWRHGNQDAPIGRPVADTSGFDLRLDDRERASALCDAVRGETPTDTILLTNGVGIHLPTLTRRHLYLPAEEEAVYGVNRTGDYLLRLWRGYDPALLDERGAAVAELYGGDPGARRDALDRILALGRPLAIVLEVERGSARYGRTPEREKESHRAADRRLLEWLRAERRGRPIYEDEGYVVWLVSPIEPARR